MSNAAEYFGIHDEQTAELYESTAHEIAFRIAADAVQHSHDEAHATLAEIVSELAQRPADQLDVALFSIIERLLIFIRLIAASSPHPLADSLRTHADLTSVKAEQFVDGLSAWLSEQQGDAL